MLQIARAPEAILNIGFEPSDRERMTQLMESAKEDDLSDEQAEELEHYRHIGRLLELMSLSGMVEIPRPFEKPQGMLQAK